MKKIIFRQDGLTLVELVIALSISIIVIAAIYSAYTLQRKTNSAQDQVTGVQQNLRAVELMLSREIKMAGYDPDIIAFHSSCNASGGGAQVYPGIHTASATTFGFSMDLNEDGNCNNTGENVTYSLYQSTSTSPDFQNLGGDKIQYLVRVPIDTGSTVSHAIAENIEAIEFLYLLKDGTQTTTPAATKLDDIRSVTVSILARSAVRDAKFINNTSYTPASGANWSINGAAAAGAPGAIHGAAANTIPGDEFRRRMFMSKIDCRNMGN